MEESVEACELAAYCTQQKSNKEAWLEHGGKARTDTQECP